LAKDCVEIGKGFIWYLTHREITPRAGHVAIPMRVNNNGIAIPQCTFGVEVGEMLNILFYNSRSWPMHRAGLGHNYQSVLKGNLGLDLSVAYRAQGESIYHSYSFGLIIITSPD
jgi:hypothetical protein